MKKLLIILMILSAISVFAIDATRYKVVAYKSETMKVDSATVSTIAERDLAVERMSKINGIYKVTIETVK